MTGVCNYINKAPEAETNTENTNCGITWNQEDNDMLYRCVLYTHIYSGNLFKSKEGVRSFNLPLMLINMTNTIILTISSFETNTFVLYLALSLSLFFRSIFITLTNIN